MEKTKKQNPQMNQNQIENTNLQEKQFEKEAMKVSTVSIVVNVLLSLFKLLAGVIAHSGAMISDAIHSASDVFSTIIVMVGIHLAGRKSDKEHPYGHERMECVAAIVLATVLAVTGLGIGWSNSSCRNRSWNRLVSNSVYCKREYRSCCGSWCACSCCSSSVDFNKGRNVLVHKIPCKKNRFQCLNGRCMASSLRCTFLSWCISWYRSFQNGISVNGPTRQPCYLCFY